MKYRGELVSRWGDKPVYLSLPLPDQVRELCVVSLIQVTAGVCVGSQKKCHRIRRRSRGDDETKGGRGLGWGGGRVEWGPCR